MQAVYQTEISFSDFVSNQILAILPNTKKAETRPASIDKSAQVTFQRSRDRKTILIEMVTEGSIPLWVWQNAVVGGPANLVSNATALPIGKGKMLYQSIWSVDERYTYNATILRNGSAAFARILG